MNSVTLYFAGAWEGTPNVEEVKGGIRNKLCSFLYPMQFDGWIKITKNVPGKIIIDSGAFSAWNKGTVVDFTKYIDYCKKCIQIGKDEGKTVRVVNLDIIPGQKGKTTSLNKSVKSEDKAIIEKAASDGYDNLRRMKDSGITPIHVFHQGEDFKWLDKMVKETDYIGVSPANDIQVSQKRLWIERAFSYIALNKIDVKTHGFAVFSPIIIRTYPWTSVDAATWRLVAGYGGIYYPHGGFSDPDYSRNPLILAISNVRHGLTEYTGFYKEWKDLLKRDGYTQDMLQDWGERCKVNVRYFLELEKWINKQKPKLSFLSKPTFSLLAQKGVMSENNKRRISKNTV